MPDQLSLGAPGEMAGRLQELRWGEPGGRVRGSHSPGRGGPVTGTRVCLCTCVWEGALGLGTVPLAGAPGASLGSRKTLGSGKACGSPGDAVKLAGSHARLSMGPEDCGQDPEGRRAEGGVVGPGASESGEVGFVELLLATGMAWGSLDALASQGRTRAPVLVASACASGGETEAQRTGHHAQSHSLGGADPSTLQPVAGLRPRAEEGGGGTCAQGRVGGGEGRLPPGRAGTRLWGRPGAGQAPSTAPRAPPGPSPPLLRAAQKLSLASKRKKPHPPPAPAARSASLYPTDFSGVLQLWPPPAPPCLLRAASKVKDSPGSTGKVDPPLMWG